MQADHQHAAHEVSLCTDQLQAFLDTLGLAALSSIKSLQVRQAKDSLQQPSPSTATTIAKLLASACPNLTHLALGGFEGVALLQEFRAPRCPSISSLQLQCNNQQRKFSHTQSQMPAYLQPDSMLCSAALTWFPSLLHLCTESLHHFENIKDWLALPSTLKHLSCPNIPSEGRALLQQGKGPILTALHTLQLSGNLSHVWEVEVLSALLDAAPNLHLISSSFPPGNDAVFIGCMTKKQLLAIRTVHLRLQAGMKVEGLQLHCGTRSESAEGIVNLPLEYILERCPGLSGFVACELLSDLEWPDALCLAQLGRVFPNVRQLALTGGFRDAHLWALARCQKLKVLQLLDARPITEEGLARFIVRSSGITCVQHRLSRYINAAELQMMLHDPANAPAGGTVDHAHSSGAGSVWRCPVDHGEWKVNPPCTSYVFVSSYPMCTWIKHWPTSESVVGEHQTILQPGTSTSSTNQSSWHEDKAMNTGAWPECREHLLSAHPALSQLQTPLRFCGLKAVQAKTADMVLCWRCISQASYQGQWVNSNQSEHDIGNIFSWYMMLAVCCYWALWVSARYLNDPR